MGQGRSVIGEADFLSVGFFGGIDVLRPIPKPWVQRKVPPTIRFPIEFVPQRLERTLGRTLADRAFCRGADYFAFGGNSDGVEFSAWLEKGRDVMVRLAALVFRL